MKVIYNNWLPFNGFAAMNICGILFVRNGVKVSDLLLNHEEIHTAQMKDEGYFLFYVKYLIFWIRNLFYFGFNHDAYYNIPYEREAYENEKYADYLNVREKNAWKQYNKI